MGANSGGKNCPCPLPFVLCETRLSDLIATRSFHPSGSPCQLAAMTDPDEETNSSFHDLKTSVLAPIASGTSEELDALINAS